QLIEQENFRKQQEAANTEYLKQYNQNPQNYGVDESEVRNPFGAFAEVPPDTPEEQAQQPTFLQRHQEMVDRGNRIIKVMSDEGITPAETEKQFWTETYDKLPEEI